MSGYTRQSAASITTGATIEASHFNNEFNAIQTAFDASSGHTHDGTSGSGPLLSITGSTSGTLSVARGGTGATTASAARTALGLVIGTDVQAYDAELASLAGLTSAADKVPYFTGSGTATVADFTSFGRSLVDDANASAARTTLGVIIGTDVQAYDATLAAWAAYNTNGILTQTAADTFTGRTITGTANQITVTNGNGVSGNPTLSIPDAITFTGKTVTDGTFNATAITTSSATITGGSISGITDLAVADGGTGASSAADARTNLGLGTIATQNANNVTISGGAITGITDLAVADGGTGASTAADARTNLAAAGTGVANTFTINQIIQNATSAAIALDIDQNATNAVSVKIAHAGGSSHGIDLNLENAAYASDGFAINSTTAGGTGFNYINCRGNAASEQDFVVRGDGTLFADNGTLQTPADYAEYFETLTGDSIPVGTSVVLDGEKVRIATLLDDPSDIIGVTRPKTGGGSLTMNAAGFRWTGQYLKDEFGATLYDEEGKRIPNPNYDSNYKYVPREKRPEWVVVGLLGQIPVRKNQPTGLRWKKMKSVSNEVDMWFVR